MSGKLEELLLSRGRSLAYGEVLRQLCIYGCIDSRPSDIVKTTAMQTMCLQNGFEPHEFNESDDRNKVGEHTLAETLMVANDCQNIFRSAETTLQHSSM